MTRERNTTPSAPPLCDITKPSGWRCTSEATHESRLSGELVRACRSCARRINRELRQTIYEKIKPRDGQATGNVSRRRRTKPTNGSPHASPAGTETTDEPHERQPYLIWPLDMFVDANGVPRLGSSGNPARLRSMVVMELDTFKRLLRENPCLATLRFEVAQYVE